MIFYPPPVDKVHAPPKVKSWNRHWIFGYLFDMIINDVNVNRKL